MEQSERVLIERLLVITANTEKNITDMKRENERDFAELKGRMPENLTQRLVDMEKDVKSLGNWRTGIVAVGTFLAGLLTFGEKVFAVLKGIH